MSSGLPDWLSEDSILMLAAGFGAGLAAALAVFGIRSMIRKKKRDKKNASGDRKGGQKMEGDSCITERVSGKRGTAAETRAVRLPAPASMPDAAQGTVGTVHHIGRRKSQPDQKRGFCNQNYRGRKHLPGKERKCRRQTKKAAAVRADVERIPGLIRMAVHSKDADRCSGYAAAKRK